MNHARARRDRNKVRTAAEPRTTRRLFGRRQEAPWYIDSAREVLCFQEAGMRCVTGIIQERRLPLDNRYLWTGIKPAAVNERDGERYHR